MDDYGFLEYEYKILTKQEAEAFIVGKAREEPNRDPVLEIPQEGRKWSDRFSRVSGLIHAILNIPIGIFNGIKIAGTIILIIIILYIVFKIYNLF